MEFLPSLSNLPDSPPRAGAHFQGSFQSVPQTDQGFHSMGFPSHMSNLNTEAAQTKSPLVADLLQPDFSSGDQALSSFQSSNPTNLNLNPRFGQTGPNYSHSNFQDIASETSIHAQNYTPLAQSVKRDTLDSLFSQQNVFSGMDPWAKSPERSNSNDFFPPNTGSSRASQTFSGSFTDYSQNATSPFDLGLPLSFDFSTQNSETRSYTLFGTPLQND